MKKEIRVLLLALSLACLLPLVSCQKKATSSPDTVRVKIPWFTSGQYDFKVVELNTLQDINELKGSAGRFLLNPSLENGTLKGASPKIKTIKTDDNTYIPADSLSLQLLTLYAHLEKLAELDHQMGVYDPASWPRTVLVGANTHRADGKPDQDNARFSSALNAFLFVPYEQPDLPLIVNSGVIGHEHFHSIFNRVVLKKLSISNGETALVHREQEKNLYTQLGLDVTLPKVDSPTLRSSYHDLLFRGMNEGLADIWGWIYSGDTQFVERSLWRYSVDRDLSKWTEPIVMSPDRVKTHLQETTAYTYGTQIARVLFEGAQSLRYKNGLSAETTRLKMGQALVKAFPQLINEFQALAATDELPPTRILEIIRAQMPDLTLSYKAEP